MFRIGLWGKYWPGGWRNAQSYGVLSLHPNCSTQCHMLNALCPMPHAQMERHLCRAICAYQERRLSDADIHLCAALEWHPDSRSLRLARSLLFLERGYPREALRILQSLSEDRIATVADYYLMAVVAWHCQDLTIAEYACRAVLARVFSHRGAASLLAATYLKRGRWRAAFYWWLRSRGLSSHP